MAKIYKSKGDSRRIVTIIVTLVLVVSIIYGIWFVADSLSKTQDKETLAAAERAIIKASVQAYALEGRYPTGIKYLEENYGLTLDRNKYVYHYESIGANMMPIVMVYPIKR